MHRHTIHGYDFSPLFRNIIGFDRIADLATSTARANTAEANYPPYNIAKINKDNYRITLAVAGFSLDELAIEQEANMVVISGKKDAETETGAYLHRGLGQRSFTRRFHLGAHIRVVGAELESGLLHVDLVHELPEALQPRKIAIAAQNQRREASPKRKKTPDAAQKKVA